MYEKTKTLTKRRWIQIVIILLLILLGPYLYSRLTSPMRNISIQSEEVKNPESKSPEEPLRIIAYNIAHGRGLAKSNWDGGNKKEKQERLDQIAKLLKEIDADIVVLNEVDFNCSWTHSVNQASYLAEKSGYPFRVEQLDVDVRILGWKWRFGNAVLSKYPITKANIVHMPSYSVVENIIAGKKRGIDCEINLGEQEIRIIGTHLCYRDEHTRVKSVNMLAQIAAESKIPTVIAGDFNSTPPGYPKSRKDKNGNNAMAFLDKTTNFKRMPEGLPITDDDLTFHADNPYNIIDWILIPKKWEFQKYKVIKSKLADHRPIFADIKFN